MTAFLTPQQEMEFRRLHKSYKKARQADRIKAILMLNEGYEFTEIAKILVMNDETIRKWYGRYLDG